MMIDNWCWVKIATRNLVLSFELGLGLEIALSNDKWWLINKNGRNKDGFWVKKWGKANTL